MLYFELYSQVWKKYFYQNCWLVGIIENNPAAFSLIESIYISIHVLEKRMCTFIMQIEHIFALFFLSNLNV
jgi:hypothetical protein